MKEFNPFLLNNFQKIRVLIIFESRTDTASLILSTMGSSCLLNEVLIIANSPVFLNNF